MSDGYLLIAVILVYMFLMIVKGLYFDEIVVINDYAY